MSCEKKPSYLYEVFDSASEEESQVENSDEKLPSRFSVFICKEIEHRPTCYLCGNILKLCFDLKEHVDQNTQHTYSDVLAKLLSNETSRRRDCNKGLLCTICKDLVKELYRLQRELRGVKNKILGIFRNSDVADISPPVSEAEVVSVKTAQQRLARITSIDTDEFTTNIFPKEKRKRKRSSKKSDGIKLIRKLSKT